MSILADPEAAWARPVSTPSVDRAEVESRIGATAAPLEVLGRPRKRFGGRSAPLNVRVGSERVLRIYRHDLGTLARERALLSRPWASFRVPRILAAGDDFLLLEHVPHRPLDDSPEHGAAAGRALAEIHGIRYPVAGHFGEGLEVAHPHPDFLADLANHVEELLLPATGAAGELRRSARRLFARELPRLRAAAGSPVLLHGDFKPSNLHWAAEGALVVLDWEFAFAGPALMDLGQLTRWQPSPGFCEAAASAYRAAGGRLVPDWRRCAQILDLGNLAGGLAAAPPGSRLEEDVAWRFRRTLEEEEDAPIPAGA